MIEPKIFCPEPEEMPKTAGKILAFAREEWDLSVKDVASNLNLGVAAINALERDQYDLLPGYTFVKGYIRSYAILLRLNPDDVIKHIDLKPNPIKMPVPSDTLKLKCRVSSDRPNKLKNKTGGLVLKSVLIIILLAGVSLFGLNQLSHLDAEKLAELLKLPFPEKADKTINDNEFSLLSRITPKFNPEN